MLACDLIVELCLPLCDRMDYTVCLAPLSMKFFRQEY